MYLSTNNQCDKMWKGNLALTRTIHITYWCNEHHPSFISYLCNKIPPKRGNIV